MPYLPHTQSTLAHSPARASPSRAPSRPRTHPRHCRALATAHTPHAAPRPPCAAAASGPPAILGPLEDGAHRAAPVTAHPTDGKPTIQILNLTREAGPTADTPGRPPTRRGPRPHPRPPHQGTNKTKVHTPPSTHNAPAWETENHNAWARPHTRGRPDTRTVSAHVSTSQHRLTSTDHHATNPRHVAGARCADDPTPDGARPFGRTRGSHERVRLRPTHASTSQHRLTITDHHATNLRHVAGAPSSNDPTPNGAKPSGRTRGSHWDASIRSARHCKLGATDGLVRSQLDERETHHDSMISAVGF